MKWGLLQLLNLLQFGVDAKKHEVAHSYLVAHTLHCGPPCSGDTVVKRDARGR